VRAHFRRRPASAKAKARDKAKAKAKPVPSRMRWFEAGDKDAHQQLEMWKPSPGKVVKDDPNGRWLLAYPGVDRKSISWTRRGQAAAAREGLAWLWSSHEAMTGEPCPLPAEYLIAE
jgi:hypothetical protein